MKKTIFFLLILINLCLLSSCNTSRPSAYLSYMPLDNPLVEHVKVSFETNGGSKVEDIEIEKGSNLKVPMTPTKEKNKFNGWYIDKELTKEYDFGTVVNSNLTLYARWTKIHLVKFVTIGGEEIEDQLVEDGYPAQYKETKREGYVFNGWYADPDYQNIFDFGKPITEDTFIYARWI